MADELIWRLRLAIYLYLRHRALQARLLVVSTGGRDQTAIRREKALSAFAEYVRGLPDTDSNLVLLAEISRGDAPDIYQPSDESRSILDGLCLWQDTSLADFLRLFEVIAQADVADGGRIV